MATFAACGEKGTDPAQLSTPQYEASSDGLPEVERREDVSPVTVIRAQELSEFFSHTRPNGEGYMSLMDEYGIQYRWAGENGAKVPATSSPSGMMNGWMNSEGHRNNILNPRHTGLEIGVYQVGQMVYCSQMFVY